jgi:SAM-dependent methyltransferase
MSTVRQHYDSHLGEIYSWTLGDFDARVGASASLFEKHLGPGLDRSAVDLGCGTGVQTLALSRLGYQVTGVDFSETMLREYRQRTSGLRVEALRQDLAELELLQRRFDVAVCLGDTVGHLQSWSAVCTMLRGTYRALNPGGTLLLATRDHSHVYRGNERALLIRADERRSLTCFLEDEGEHVRVTDLVHDRNNGSTSLHVSSYLKLRVSPPKLAELMQELGFAVAPSIELPAGVFLLRAQRGS